MGSRSDLGEGKEEKEEEKPVQLAYYGARFKIY